MVTIEQLSQQTATAQLNSLIAILQDSVDNGASVGFLPPLSEEEAHVYWQSIIHQIGSKSRFLLVASRQGQLVGTVQLELAAKGNALHRAEVQKLLVHTQFRRQGIGQALMNAVEDVAKQAGRSLLVLDTRRGDPAEQFYLKQGYIYAGGIPHYARSANGDLDENAFYYRILSLEA